MKEKGCIEVCVKTDIGRVRANNEDSYLIVDKPGPGCDTERFGLMFAVADGMGGHAAGEVASCRACEEMRTYYSAAEKQIPADRPEWMMNHLEAVIHRVNGSVYRLAQAHREYWGMGTTLSVLVLWKDRALVAHVGDSRIYRLRKGALEQLTLDHTEVQAMVDRGYLTAEEAAQHPFRHVLLQAVGVGESLEAVFTRIEAVEKGDRFLLCSDGLTDMLSDGEIKQILFQTADARSACHRLIDAAVRRGGRDNVTVMVVGI